MRLLSLQSLLKKLDCGRTALYHMRRRPDFPRPVNVGAGDRWREDEIDAWLSAEIAAGRRRGAAAPVEDAR